NRSARYCFECVSRYRLHTHSFSQDPTNFRPTSVQFKGRINSYKARKRHRTRHLEFYTPRLLTEGSQRPRSIGVGCTPFLPSVVGCIGTHRWSICAAHRSRNILGTYLASSEIRKRNQNNDLD